MLHRGGRRAEVVVGGGRRRCRVTGRRGGRGVGGAGEVTVQVSGRERGWRYPRTTLETKILNPRLRMEGQVRRSISFPVVFFLSFLLFLSKPLPVLHLQT